MVGGCRHGLESHVNDIFAQKNKYQISHGAVERGNTPRFTPRLLPMATSPIKIMAQPSLSAEGKLRHICSFVSACFFN